MALPNRLVKGYVAQQGLRSPGTSLLSNTGRAAGSPRMATARLTEGGRIAPTQAFASRTFEGISGGLDYAQQAIPKAIISFLDQKNILSALKQKAAYQDEVSKLLYGYNEQVLQPDGSYKTEFKPGYTGLQGTEAVNSYGSYEEAVRAKHAELMDELEPAAQREFAVQSIEVLTGALTKGRQHAAGALKKASEDALDTNQYLIDYEAGILERYGANWPSGPRSVMVTYTAGLAAATADLPNDLKLAALIWCAAVYNKANVVVIILDNRITAMTGGQHHPGTGKTLMGEDTFMVDFVELSRVLGVKDIHTVDAYDVEKTKAELKKALEFDGPSVVITNRPCVLMPHKIKDLPYVVLADECNGCKLCFKIGCPAIAASKEKTEKGHPKAIIDQELCTGCTICAQVCPMDCIVPADSEAVKKGARI